MTIEFKYLFVLILCLGLAVSAGEQKNNPQDNLHLDSLITNMHATEDDTNKVIALCDLAYAYHTTSPYDGIKYGKEALTVAEEFQWEKGIAKSNSVLGINYYALSNFS